MRPAFTKCHRSTESTVAHPTHEPVEPWSPICHQSSRRFMMDGIAAAVSTTPASAAARNRQSFSVSRDGMQFRIRGGCLFFLAKTIPPDDARDRSYHYDGLGGDRHDNVQVSSGYG